MLFDASNRLVDVKALDTLGQAFAGGALAEHLPRRYLLDDTPLFVRQFLV